MRQIASVGEMVTTFAWLDYAKHGWCKFKKEMQVVVVWNIEGMAKRRYSTGGEDAIFNKVVLILSL
ncbi:hypothetical protein TSUD_258650 [Trifolium subterraneum]|uniref:Uncharacterized protein n=1 Tax=Trifolium subterraneum TaxID=3900 RepID=A0A2Z6NGY3_TRISU|nr:hypothetical protein TSUD_258650 [Trifolium subterraneum]